MKTQMCRPFNCMKCRNAQSKCYLFNKTKWAKIPNFFHANKSDEDFHTYWDEWQIKYNTQTTNNKYMYMYTRKIYWLQPKISVLFSRSKFLFLYWSTSVHRTSTDGCTAGLWESHTGLDLSALLQCKLQLKCRIRKFLELHLGTITP